MINKSKAYSYPVMTPHGVDYNSTSFFNVDLDLEVTDGRNLLHCNYGLQNTVLQDFVDQETAVFGLDVYVRETMQRNFIQMSKGASETEIDLDLIGPIEVTPYIVCKKTAEFEPTDINPEYRQTVFRVEPGMPLAIGSVYTFEVVPEYLSQRPTFKLESVSTYPPHKYELKDMGDTLTLKVSEQLLEAIEVARSDSTTKAMLMPSIYQDAIEMALTEIKNNESDGLWARSLLSTLESSGIKFDEYSDLTMVASELLWSKGWKKVLNSGKNQGEN